MYPLLDPVLKPPSDLEALKRIANVACKCVRMKGKERPSMDKVTTALERALAQLMGSPCNEQLILPSEVVLGSNRLHKKSSQRFSNRSASETDVVVDAEDQRFEFRAPSWITVPSVTSSQRRKSSVSEADVDGKKLRSKKFGIHWKCWGWHLSTQNLRQADEETRRLLIVLAGEATQKRGYVFFSEVQFISEKDLKAIDELWKQYSNNKFGYSIQKRIWQKNAGKDFTKFFLKVGWMKKLDTEVVQYNYRSFPNEFIWELNDDTPEGHLPLTNALRGTQLLNSILNHPAFEDIKEEDEVDGENKHGKPDNGLREEENSSKPLSKRLFKPNYSF
ncbi:hypothetical protein GH714_010809 [Hevea brasiliensis]|uniref:GUN4-like domain-containing protein n=1 Tax=Hevea brasiliensis TaxID=3981 RepID=A0A6A6LGT7_HEVBR|nr:hypothetical protein GH714_010809 [Hevea brasiliensis]